MPIALLRMRNVATANTIGILWAAAMFGWFFVSALYLQLVLGYSPLAVGLAFLPGNVVMGALSVGVSAQLVMRFGIKPPLRTGLLLAAAGLLLFARAPVGGCFVVDVLPSMLLLGIGAGIAFNPVLLAAMSDVSPEQSGLASGVVNTAFMMGGALGLAVLASLAAARTSGLHAAGQSSLDGAGRRLPPGVPVSPRSSPRRQRRLARRSFVSMAGGWRTTATTPPPSPSLTRHSAGSVTDRSGGARNASPAPVAASPAASGRARPWPVGPWLPRAR